MSASKKSPAVIKREIAAKIQAELDRARGLVSASRACRIMAMRRAYKNLLGARQCIEDSRHESAVRFLRLVAMFAENQDVQFAVKKTLGEIEGGTMDAALIRCDDVATALDQCAYSFAAKAHDEKHAPTLPPFKQRINKEGATRGNISLEWYNCGSLKNVSPEFFQGVLTSLLTDLHHACHERKLAPSIIAECFRVARGHFIEQTNTSK